MMWACVCGGQGRLTADSFAIFEAMDKKPAPLFTATDFLKQDVLEFYKKLDAQQRAENLYNQFFSVLYALCMFDTIKDYITSPYAVAGYSVGEIAALQIAGVFSTAESLKVTWKRAHIMNEACNVPCQMAFSMGLPQAQVEKLCQAHEFAIAIRNPGQFFVLAGKKENIDNLIADLLKNGAKRAEPIHVMIASHTYYLSQSMAVFSEYLKNIEKQKIANNVILFNGLDGGRAFNTEIAVQKTAKALGTMLDWQAVIESLLEQGVRHIIDLGPGNALSNMVRSNYPNLTAYAACDFHSIAGLQEWFLKHQQNN